VAGAWIIVSVVAGFPARWETIFQTVVAALTLAMVFVIQHSQARHQRATQRKLDEILLAIPRHQRPAHARARLGRRVARRRQSCRVRKPSPAAGAAGSAAVGSTMLLRTGLAARSGTISGAHGIRATRPTILKPRRMRECAVSSTMVRTASTCGSSMVWTGIGLVTSIRLLQVPHRVAEERAEQD
jgi:hypothetical protein